jgi:hypothetical protein
VTGPALTDEDLDDLFAAAPADFIGSRDALARRLKQAGEREAAAEVARLRKPTAVAWALNQLSRRERAQVDALLRADEHLRSLMQSAGRGGELRAASEQRRTIVRDLARVAAAILAGGGHKATPTANEKIFETLQAVATDREAREALRRGRLTGDVSPSGFGEDLMAAAPPAGPAGGGRDEGARRADEHRVRLAEARQAAREREEEAAEKRRTAERLARDAAEAERLARRARKDADRAEAALGRAVQAAEEAARLVAELGEEAGGL